MNKRVEWIDNIKGFGLLLIVWGHCFVPMYLKTWMYSFHVPLFFFISGYLFKKRVLSETIKIKAKSLLIPYFVFALVSFPVGFVYDMGFGLQTSLPQRFADLFYLNGSVGWNGPLWFLVVLFLVEVIYSAAKNVRVNDYIVIALFLVLGYVLYINHIILPFGLHIVTWSIPFYALGKVLKEKKVINNLSKHKYILFVVFFTINLILAFVNTDVAEIYHSRLGNYFIFFIAAISGTLALIFFLVKTKKIPLLTLFAKNSIIVIGTHYYLLFFLRVVDKLFLNNFLVSMGLLSSIINLLFMVLVYLILFKLKNNLVNRRAK